MGGIEYDVSVDGGYASAVNGNQAVGDVVVRELVEYDGNIYPVTRIERRLFYDNNQVTGIDYPPGQWGIEIKNCPNLTTLTVRWGPKDITLYGVPKLTNLILPSTLERAWIVDCAISELSFDGDPAGLKSLSLEKLPNLSSLDLSSRLESITAKECTALESLDLTNVTRLQRDAFYKSKNLKEIYLGKSLVEINGGVAESLVNLKDIIYAGTIEDWCRIGFVNYDDLDDDGILKYATHLWHSHGKSKLTYLTELGYRDLVGFDEVPDYSFAGYKGLTKVSLPASIKTIGKAAFAGCTNLKYISIGAETIKKFAFRRVNAFDEFHFNSNLKLMISPFETFHKNGTFPKVYYDGTIQSLTKIKRTNQDSDGCATICCPNVIQLAWGGFYMNGELVTDLVIPADVDTISSGLFAYLPCLKSVSFQRGSGCVIESESFDQCQNLAEVKYRDASQNSLTSKSGSQRGFVIGNHAFRYCNQLLTIEILDNLDRVATEAFSGTGWLNNQPDGIIYLPLNNGMAAYCVKGDCLSAGTNIVIPEGVTEIVGSAFINQKGITGLSLPSTLKKIGGFAFDGCESLNGTLSLGSNIEEIGDYAFRDTKYSKVSIDDSNNPIVCGASVLNNFNELYLGRQVEDGVAFDGYYVFDAADKITYGKYVSSIRYLDAPTGNQRGKSTPLEVVSMNTQPPVCVPFKSAYPWEPDEYPFDNLDVSRCVLKVPEESVDLYKSANGWRNFTNVEGVAFAGVSSTLADDGIEIIGVFDVSGRPVALDTKGIIMVKYSDGSVRKMLNQ